MNLIEIRQAIVDTVKDALPTLRTIETHGGRFDAGELARVSARAPAVFVAAMRLGRIEARQGSVLADVNWAMFVVTKDEPAVHRDAAALLIVNALTGVVSSARWDIAASTDTPKDITAQNLFSAAFDQRGVACWALSWTQRMSILHHTDESTLDRLLQIFTTTDIDPNQGDEPPLLDSIDFPID